MSDKKSIEHLIKQQTITDNINNVLKPLKSVIDFTPPYLSSISKQEGIINSLSSPMLEFTKKGQALHNSAINSLAALEKISVSRKALGLESVAETFDLSTKNVAIFLQEYQNKVSSVLPSDYTQLLQNTSTMCELFSNTSIPLLKKEVELQKVNDYFKILKEHPDICTPISSNNFSHLEEYEKQLDNRLDEIAEVCSAQAIAELPVNNNTVQEFKTLSPVEKSQVIKNFTIAFKEFITIIILIIKLLIPNALPGIDLIIGSDNVVIQSNDIESRHIFLILGNNNTVINYSDSDDSAYSDSSTGVKDSVPSGSTEKE